MTPEALAALQARAYRDMAPWSARDFADMLGQPTVLLCASPDSFCLGRVVLDEAEILALATDPDHQRNGQGSRTLRAFLQGAAARGALNAFLEVASGNAPALSFYRHHGFARTGLRKGYYRLPDGSRADALLMARALTKGHVPGS